MVLEPSVVDAYPPRNIANPDTPGVWRIAVLRGPPANGAKRVSAENICVFGSGVEGRIPRPRHLCGGAESVIVGYSHSENVE